MKLLSLFSGIGAFEKALDRLNINYQLVNYCEIDKYASKAYAAIHGVSESLNLGDITKVDEKALPKDIDLITYGFPCQDISNAGKMKGLFNSDGSQTRSGLFFEALRIIEETQPRVAIAENVKNLTSKKFNAQFQIVLASLEAAGYNNYWQILNSKDYGIPQNRERVFIVSIRKDIDTGMFRFPEEFPLELRLKDLCDAVVDEKYYLSDANIAKIQKSNFTQEATRIQNDDVCQTLLARDYKDPKCIEQPMIMVREATKKGYAEAYEGDSINLEQPNSQTRRGRVGKQVAQTLTTSCNQAVAVAEPNVLSPKRTEYGKAIRKAYESGEISESRHNMTELIPRTDGISNTLTTVQKDNYLVEPSLRIRKLTPKEYFRLQDFDDEDFSKAESVCSNTQLYKQAGNSITVACPYYIFKALIEANIFTERKNKEMELKIKEITFPEVIEFNFDELKQEITDRVSMYNSLVYTEKQVKDAKTDRANLNKFLKALSDERIKVKKQCLQPYEAFEAKVNELSKIVQEPINIIDSQVKAFEEQQKQEKLDAITTYFNSTDHPEWLHLSQIMDEKWLNASFSMKAVKDAVDSRLDQIEIDITTLHDLPEFGFEATEVYKSTLDINKALNEGHRMSQIAKAKAEAEAKKQEEAFGMNPPEEEPKTDENGSITAEIIENAPVKTTDGNKQWIKFQAYMSVEDALALKNFFNSRNIEFKAV